MKNRLAITLLCCLVLIQIVVPFSMISSREGVLKNGYQLKFKTAPVDPYDAFRGRYVALRIEGDSVPVSNGVKFIPGQNVYALISVDEQGFAKFTALAKSRPKGAPYIKARVRYISLENTFLDLPIDRYYMEESSAPAAERAYREHSWRGRQDAYVLVSVKDGAVVIRGLYVGGKRIEEVIRGIKS
ncbi:MAG: GDYXXLXY domain-containing protein [Candidatus Omnitrophica bacterium]|nr:GDYXXLXY domain-containing protein [Candidatus Omnitrophota bacterium]